jgi:hypothetical protein
MTPNLAIGPSRGHGRGPAPYHHAPEAYQHYINDLADKMNAAHAQSQVADRSHLTRVASEYAPPLSEQKRMSRAAAYSAGYMSPLSPQEKVEQDRQYSQGYLPPHLRK